MKLFSKLKDYNNLLEKILERKTFSSVSKNLLLSMIYKLEISYDDYSKVKIDIISKDVFFENLLKVIDDYCDNIKVVEPESIQAKLLRENDVEAITNSKERSLLTYPTEKALFFAISDIEPKYFYIKKRFVFKNVMQRVLVNGYKQNMSEILNNFNGWSWDNRMVEKNFDYVSNFIYQNIMMILGEEFLYDWRRDRTAQRGYLQELKKDINIIIENNNYYLSLCKLLFLISEGKEKTLIKKQLEEKYVKFEKMLKASEETRKKYSKEFEELKNYSLILKNVKSIYDELEKLQIEFIKIIEKTIKKAQTKEKMLEILYSIRYYQNMYYFEGVKIKDYVTFQKGLDNISKMAITKACKMGILKIICMNVDMNFEIIRYILDTKIIDLEDIKISLELNGKSVFIKVFDKETFEKQGKLEFTR